ncbi:RepB family DNA primase [Gallionella capsiferriformans]|uniref:RepB-like DNA primase domain-containing protein n=1 Tax=Gallionella capsiferriformans (strain ES-2) TaxID=395494 RepID=D9SGA3_GALCS|nr:RepB family DNA primase [Gallionella capsiferriformans]ADL55550.1 hypothetical protein Galf_1531 [Gallionella capsiferriformans ES-2]
MKPEQQRQAMLDWLMATSRLGTDTRFDIGIGDANKALYFRRSGLSRLRSLDLQMRIPFFKAANISGVGQVSRPLNIYVCAAVTEPQSWLMMDDLTLNQSRRVAGERTHMIIQTSPGLHHLWLATSRLISIAERKACQQVLQQRYGGDAASVSGDHFGRLPGFKNIKRGKWVNFVDSKIVDRRADVDVLLELAEKQGFILPPLGGVVSAQPQANLHNAFASRVRSIAKPFIATGRNESSFEYAYARAHYEKNLTIEDGIANLAQRALDRGKRKTYAAAENYARLTFAHAATRCSVKVS